MANPISQQIKIGTIGELLVQLRLLQFNVQSASPIKDSGNDLIAIRHNSVHAIQVKTTSNRNIPKKPDRSKIYTLLAIVELDGFDNTLKLDSSNIYIMRKSEVDRTRLSWKSICNHKLCPELIDELFRESSELRLC